MTIEESRKYSWIDKMVSESSRTKRELSKNSSAVRSWGKTPKARNFKSFVRKPVALRLGLNGRLEFLYTASTMRDSDSFASIYDSGVTNKRARWLIPCSTSIVA